MLKKWQIPRQNVLNQLAENARFVASSKCCKPSPFHPWIYECIEFHIYKNVFVYICKCVCICVYTYLNLFSYMHIYTHIYTCTYEFIFKEYTHKHIHIFKQKHTHQQLTHMLKSHVFSSPWAAVCCRDSVAELCILLQCVAMPHNLKPPHSRMHFLLHKSSVAACCKVCCSVFQCTHTAAHPATHTTSHLQHTATHCNSLQHTTYQLPSSHNIHTWVAGSSNRHVPSAHPATSRCLHYSLHSAISQQTSFQICHKRLMRGSIVLIRLECMYVHVCVCVRACVSVCGHAMNITYTHTYTDADTNTLSHAHAHTHTHTPSYPHTHTCISNMWQCIYVRDVMIPKKNLSAHTVALTWNKHIFKFLFESWKHNFYAKHATECQETWRFSNITALGAWIAVCEWRL